MIKASEARRMIESIDLNKKEIQTTMEYIEKQIIENCKLKEYQTKIYTVSRGKISVPKQVQMCLKNKVICEHIMNELRQNEYFVEVLENAKGDIYCLLISLVDPKLNKKESEEEQTKGGKVQEKEEIQAAEKVTIETPKITSIVPTPPTLPKEEPLAIIKKHWGEKEQKTEATSIDTDGLDFSDYNEVLRYVDC